MRRLRTSYLDDLEDIESAEVPRLNIFGLSLPLLASAIAAMAPIVLFVAMFFISRQDWFPKSPVFLWSAWGVISLLMVASTALALWGFVVLMKYLRVSRASIARFDGATEEEAWAESRRFMRRSIYFKLALYFTFSATLWVIMGSPWVLDWHKTFPYLCALLVVLIFGVLYTMGHPERFLQWLRRARGRGDDYGEPG